jgi:hypothetical protein
VLKTKGLDIHNLKGYTAITLATPTKPLFADFQEVQEQVQHAILELQV